MLYKKIVLMSDKNKKQGDQGPTFCKSIEDIKALPVNTVFFYKPSGYGLPYDDDCLIFLKYTETTAVKAKLNGSSTLIEYRNLKVRDLLVGDGFEFSIDHIDDQFDLLINLNWNPCIPSILWYGFFLEYNWSSFYWEKNLDICRYIRTLMIIY